MRTQREQVGPIAPAKMRPWLTWLESGLGVRVRVRVRVRVTVTVTVTVKIRGVEAGLGLALGLGLDGALVDREREQDEHTACE